MFRQRRVPDARDATPDARTNLLVFFEAEAIVHRAWQNQLRERRQEIEAALRRAETRCDTAQRSLTAAQRSGDPRQIATSHSDLEKALEAARKTTFAWDQVRHVLSVEAGLPATATPGSAVTAAIGWTDSVDSIVSARADRGPDPSPREMRAADLAPRRYGRFAYWVYRATTLFPRQSRTPRRAGPIDLPANQG